MGRLVGIDFGLKRIGLARTDPQKILASPLPTILAGKNLEETVEIILKAIEPIDEIEAFVVGLPLTMAGQDSPMTTAARAFAEALERISQKKVTLYDERLTSKLVEKEMINAKVNRKKRAKVVDQLAAVTILQSYLEAQ